ncbi:MAG: hypothetical protein GIW97_05790, partial [Candidatus Eremiobacteraeota bacterium]|nr:hypothetical protein [Candidatus Eremiobacteraeota bacterium]
FFGLSMFGNHGLTGSVQFAGGDRSANISYATLQASISGAYSVSPDGGAAWAINGSVTARRRLFEVSAFHSATNEDDVIRTHAVSGPGVIVGIERVVNGAHARIGPIIGLSVPIGHTSAFEMTDHPTATGRTLAFGFSQRISFAPRVHRRTIRIENAAPAQLYIDDRLARRIDGGVSTIAIEPGSHHIQARTQDGTFMSLPATIQDDSTSVDLAMLPVRTIAGRVVQSDADPAGRKISLEHIQIKLEPGGILAETAADGSFEIAAGPVAPNARISIDKDSLPDGLSVGDDAPADAVPLVLSVKTRIKVHRKKF